MTVISYCGYLKCSFRLLLFIRVCIPILSPSGFVGEVLYLLLSYSPLSLGSSPLLLLGFLRKSEGGVARW